ncbi:hypothetical protein BYT27DRAFT_7005183, partial [Phlegmacium glaucopus]
SNFLNSTVPKLGDEGGNWGIFLICFKDAVQAKGFWGHFDGSCVAPVLPAEPSTAKIATLEKWEKDEFSAKTLLT